LKDNWKQTNCIEVGCSARPWKEGLGESERAYILVAMMPRDV